MIGIYLIENLINGKKYVGQAENIGPRWSTHIRRGTNDENNRNELIYTAIKKYGIENFSFRILEECDLSSLDDREAYWINFYNTYIYNPNSHGYNILPGGQSTRKITNEAITQIINLWNQGLTIKEIHEQVNFCNEVITNILKEHSKTYTPTESNLRAYMHGTKNIKVNKYNLKCELIGSYPSITTAASSIKTDRDNLSRHLEFKTKTCCGYIFTHADSNQYEELSRHLDIISEKHQPIMQIDKNNKLVNCYPTMKEASLQTGVGPKTIRRSCKGETYISGNYHWEYLNISIFNYINFIAPTKQQEEELLKKIMYTTEDGFAEEKIK